MPRLGWGIAFCLAWSVLGARAETLKLAIGQRGNWDTAVAELGQRAGIFKRHGLELELLYTAGGGETQQAVLSRSVDIGVAAGTLGALSVAAKGAPIRIIGAETTGATELYWYVPSTSAVHAVQDLAGQTVAFSTVGSSTNSVLLMAREQFGVALQPTATGGLPATYTQALSGQIAAGWAAAPFGLDALKAGTIRPVFYGRDIKGAQDQTIRVLITHAAVLSAKQDAIDRFMLAYRETLSAMYSDPAMLQSYAAFAGISPETAGEMRDRYFPPAALDPDRVSGLEGVMADAVRFKFMAAPLSAQQLAQTIVLQKVKP